MRLCFGTFAKVLVCCGENIQQAALVARIAKCVDPHSNYMANETRYKKEHEWDIAGDGPAISKLLHCKKNFVFASTQKPAITEATENFKAGVMPCISADKLTKAMLAILRIISWDESLGTEYKETFRKSLGVSKDGLLRQTKFDVPDFFTKVLLYTTCVDNTDRQPCVEEITTDFIEETANSSWVDVKWDDATQTMELTPTAEGTLFNNLLFLWRCKLDVINAEMEDRYAPPSSVAVELQDFGINERDLFPNINKPIRFKDAESKERCLTVVQRLSKLTHELLVCLGGGKENQKADWPMFPNKRTLDIWNQIEEVQSELQYLRLFQTWNPSGQEGDFSSS